MKQNYYEIQFMEKVMAIKKLWLLKGYVKYLKSSLVLVVETRIMKLDESFILHKCYQRAILSIYYKL